MDEAANRRLDRMIPTFFATGTTSGQGWSRRVQAELDKEAWKPGDPIEVVLGGVKHTWRADPETGEVSLKSEKLPEPVRRDPENWRDSFTENWLGKVSWGPKVTVAEFWAKGVAAYIERGRELFRVEQR
jgi:hypothetical protein